tara:strand:- start:1917 stop:2084 length:168 start_codon:yes stop_codon:yes gene_type:complete
MNVLVDLKEEELLKIYELLKTCKKDTIVVRDYTVQSLQAKIKSTMKGIENENSIN